MIESRKKRLSYNLKDIIEEVTGEPIEKYNIRLPEKQETNAIKQEQQTKQLIQMKKNESNIATVDNEMLVWMIAALLTELQKRYVTGTIFKPFLFN